MSAQWLDELPLDFSNPAVREIRSVLSNNFMQTNQVITFVRDVGGKPALVNWNQPMSLVWDDVLTVLSNQGKLRALLRFLIDGDFEGVAARLGELTADQPVVAAPTPSRGKVDWPAAEPGGFEKIVAGESTLLDVAFLQRGLELAPAVVRLLVRLNGAPFFGTAFRIGPDLFLTNHHVLFAADGTPATRVEAWFGYERAFEGETKAHVSVDGDVATIVGDATHDWAVIRLGATIPDSVPVIDVRGTATVKPDDRVYIIQHPQGGVKKIGMIHNIVRYVDDDVIRYWTDTEEGSSGSPVFDERWRLVALHHYWVTYTSGTTTEIRNQGQRIERVVAGLTAAGVI